MTPEEVAAENAAIVIATRSLIRALRGWPDDVPVKPPPVERDSRDRELREQLAAYYAETWAMARAQNETEDRS